nr:uncharacterized protein LOC129265579 [Lytechinus pictus]
MKLVVHKQMEGWMSNKAGTLHRSCSHYFQTHFLHPFHLDRNSSTKWQPPPRKHCIAQVTGGLEDIYTKIESGWQNADEDFSKCINEENFFQPNSKGGLLAGRYQVIRILGRGISSTILQAQDTFRPGLYEVAIKVLKPEFYRLGYQESHLIAELNKADSHNFCGIVRLLNTFTLGSFFCMTFELLRPWPLHQVFKKITDKKEVS